MLVRGWCTVCRRITPIDVPQPVSGVTPSGVCRRCSEEARFRRELPSRVAALKARRPNPEWTDEQQTVFRDTLARVARVAVRAQRRDELSAALSGLGSDALEPEAHHAYETALQVAVAELGIRRN